MIRCDECGFLVTAEHKTNRHGSHYNCSWRRLDYRCVQGSVTAERLEAQLAGFVEETSIPKKLSSADAFCSSSRFCFRVSAHPRP
jgi:hypothetical protein